MYPNIAASVTAAVALAVVLGLVWLGARVLRQGGWATHAAGARVLVLRDVLALDARRRLHVVRCDGRDVLLLTGGPQDLVVGWLEHGAPDGLPPRAAGARQ